MLGLLRLTQKVPLKVLLACSSYLICNLETVSPLSSLLTPLAGILQHRSKSKTVPKFVSYLLQNLSQTAHGSHVKKLQDLGQVFPPALPANFLLESTLIMLKHLKFKLDVSGVSERVSNIRDVDEALIDSCNFGPWEDKLSEQNVKTL